MAKNDEAKLHKWQDRFVQAKADYEQERKLMVERDNFYNGDKTIYSPNGQRARKDAHAIRNIIFELIESQVEATYPTPKVTPYEEQNEEKAIMIEDMLRNEMDRIKIERLNDTDERTTYTQGGDFFLIEWDSSQRTHTTMGELNIQLVHPRKVIPQRGVESLEQADWVFLELAQTKEYIKRRYDVDVSEESEENPEIRGQEKKPSENMVTQIIVLYRNKNGGIGRFSWVNDLILEDLEDCQAPMQKWCNKCDIGFSANYDECPYCGNKKLTTRVQDYIELEQDIVLYDDDGNVKKVIPAYTQATDEFGMPMEEPMLDNMGMPVLDMQYDEMGMPVMNELGVPALAPKMQPVMVKTQIPVYKPTTFPLVMRKNVSIDGKFLGNSDIDFIRDQQNEINKYLTKIAEKTLKGGSLVSIPESLNVDETDEEMRIVRAKNPDQANMIKVFNLQADFSGDMEMTERTYEWARQTIGITDSFQGREDNTATSKIAKEFAAQQSAGRFESKKVMKRACYADIYEAMFQVILASMDDERHFRAVDQLGNDVYRHFCKWEFLEQDDAGEWYWDDRFMFGTDNTGNLAQNREALWQETRNNFESGAFGNPQDINVLIIYWTMMKDLHYPLAAKVIANLEEQREMQMAMQQQAMMAQQQMLQQQAQAQAMANVAGATQPTA